MDALLSTVSSMPAGALVTIVVSLAACIILFFLDTGGADINNTHIKDHRIKDGPYGDARFATKEELKREDDMHVITFAPKAWRKGKNLPTEAGILLGNWHEKAKRVNKKGFVKYLDKNDGWHGGTVKAFLCTNDTHALLVASSGAGKTAFFLDPQIEYALATGISFVVTDTKGDIDRQYSYIAEKYYGYKTVSLNLRSPMRSSKFNILHMVSKYTKLYKDAAAKDPTSEDTLMYQARRETYAKICAKTIILSGTDGNFGQNSFFYDSAEGLLTACILLVCEYAKPEEQHIISVYKLIQAISGSETDSKGDTKTEVQKLMDLLPDDSKIKMFAGASAQSGGEGQASVLSTAMSRLISFLDSETEQILCFDSEIDAENFVDEKTMIILTMPEEFNTRYFMVSLVIQELYRELLTIADSYGGKVPKTKYDRNGNENGYRGKTGRVMFFLDEFGTLPKIDSAEMMFSAARSRNIFFVPIVQGTVQLDKNYGKTGGAIIRDNCQLQLFTGISPMSQDAENFSKLLGTYTAKGASVSHSGKAGRRSKTDNVVSVSLMTADEIRNLAKGDFIVMRTGKHPMKTHFDIFLDWGIPAFKEEKEISIQQSSAVQYASKDEIIKNILESSSVKDVQQTVTDETVSSAIDHMNQTKADEAAEREAEKADYDALPSGDELNSEIHDTTDEELDSDDEDFDDYG